jgi:hypothetical protein
MAYFAELNSSNEVLRVVSISNEQVDANGGDYSTEAESYVESIVPFSSGGSAWKQTSYNNNARKQYAGVGYSYDSGKDVFIAPKPYNSWSLDSNNDWQAPVAFPSELFVDSNPLSIFWDESNLRWLGEFGSNNYVWNPDTSQWSSI